MRAPVELNHSRSSHGLGEVFVWRTNHDTFDASVLCSDGSCGSQSVVSLELHHRPNHDAGRREDLLKQRKLRQQLRLDAVTSFVSRPQLVAKRLDDVIGGNRDVRRPALDHSQHRREDATHRAHFASLLVACGRHRIVMPEQLVRAVNQKDFHGQESAGYYGRE